MTAAAPGTGCSRGAAAEARLGSPGGRRRLDAEELGRRRHAAGVLAGHGEQLVAGLGRERRRARRCGAPASRRRRRAAWPTGRGRSRRSWRRRPPRRAWWQLARRGTRWAAAAGSSRRARTTRPPSSDDAGRRATRSCSATVRRSRTSRRRLASSRVRLVAGDVVGAGDDGPQVAERDLLDVGERPRRRGRASRRRGTRGAGPRRCAARVSVGTSGTPSAWPWRSARRAPVRTDGMPATEELLGDRLLLRREALRAARRGGRGRGAASWASAWAAAGPGARAGARTAGTAPFGRGVARAWAIGPVVADADVVRGRAVSVADARDGRSPAGHGRATAHGRRGRRGSR